MSLRLEWLSFIIDHPAADNFGRAEAQRLLDDVRNQVPAEEFSAAVERGKELTLEDVINDLLPEL